MNNYIKFMLLGTSLLASNVHAIGDKNHNNQSVNPEKEEQTENTAAEEMIEMENNLREDIKTANSGSVKSQNLVAKTFIKYPHLLVSEGLLSTIELDKWLNLEKRVEHNTNLLAFIINTDLYQKVNLQVKNSIFEVLDKKHNEKTATSEEIRLLGIYCLHDSRKSQNKKKVAKLFDEAAKLGNINAMCNLGFCFSNGYGVSKNEKKAVELYTQAAKLGHARAMCNLGSCFSSGYGIEKNLITALKWYLKCLEPNVAQDIKTRAITRIKNMITLKASAEASAVNTTVFSKFFKKIGFISEAPVIESEALKLDEKLKLMLDEILEFHVNKQQKYSGRFKEKAEDPQGRKHNAHRAISDAAGELSSFVTEITSDNKGYKNQSNNLNINSIVTEKAFKIPTGFMLTNVVEKQDLSGQLRIDRANKIEDSVFSITTLGSYQFYNIGHDAVKLASELSKLIGNLSKAIKTMIKIETGEMELKVFNRNHEIYSKQLELINLQIKLYDKHSKMIPSTEDQTELINHKNYIVEKMQKNKLLIEGVEGKKKDSETIKRLKIHQQNVESLEKSLGWAFAKNAGPRNNDFAELMAGVNR